MAIKTKGNTLRSRIMLSFFGSLLPCTSATMATRNHLKSIAERHLAVARHFFPLVDQGLISTEDAVARLWKSDYSMFLLPMS
jgi:hypothetical protein